MSVKDDLPVLHIKHRGFFNYSELLQAIRQWYVDDDFTSINMPSFRQKFPSPTGIDNEIEITGYKKVTEYVMFHVNVFIRVYNMRDIEIIQDGKKIKLQDGQVIVRVMTTLELDWQNRFQGPPRWQKFLSVLDDFYRNYIMKYKIQDYWEDMLLKKSSQLARLIKETLGQEVI